MSVFNEADIFLRGVNVMKYNFYNGILMIVVPIVWEIMGDSDEEVEHDWHAQRNALFFFFGLLSLLITKPSRWIENEDKEKNDFGKKRRKV